MRTLKILGLLVIGILISTLTSCEKDEVTPNNPPSPVDHTFDVGSAKTADFFGTIVDENNLVVAGADITIGNKTGTTNDDGVFFIENASVYQNHAYVKAEKEGYFLGSRSLVPSDGVNTVRIMLLEKENIGNFDASAGGQVSGNGITIDFAAGIVDASGNAHAGNVNVAAKYINPESDNFADYMPGGLIGANADGSNYLESYGMVAVELTDDAGNELQLADGSPAEVSFPLSASLQGSAPASIPLWSFDEEKGYWVEEGNATLEGGVYKGEVSHFSFWNCDIPTDYVIINGQVTDTTGAGVSGLLVEIESTGYGSGYAWLDDSGEYGGIVPANDALTLHIKMDCGSGYEIIHTESIGSFSSDATIPTIDIVASATTVNLVGTIVDCDNAPVGNGYISYNGQSITLTGGSFSVFGCDGNDVTIQGFDLDNLNESGELTYTLSGGLLDVGQVVACDGITEYIMWNVNGTDYIATSGFNTWEQGATYVGFSGDNPSYFSFNSNAFSGEGTYVCDNSFTHSIYGENIAEIESGSIDMNISQWGGNSGDLIEADFSGSIIGYDSLGPGVSQTISGNIHFFRN